MCENDECMCCIESNKTISKLDNQIEELQDKLYLAEHPNPCARCSQPAPSVSKYCSRDCELGFHLFPILDVPYSELRARMFEKRLKGNSTYPKLPPELPPEVFSFIRHLEDELDRVTRAERK